MWGKGVFVYDGCRVRKVVVVGWCCNRIEMLDLDGQEDGEGRFVVASWRDEWIV
jgi:hypothetical protein